MPQQTGQPGQGQQQATLGAQKVDFIANPPAVVTDKDHLYLKDALSWELLAMKKCHEFAGKCQDPEIADFVNRTGRMHQQHYLRLLNEVNPDKSLH